MREETLDVVDNPELRESIRVLLRQFVPLFAREFTEGRETDAAIMIAQECTSFFATMVVSMTWMKGEEATTKAASALVDAIFHQMMADVAVVLQKHNLIKEKADEIFSEDLIKVLFEERKGH